jgi:hypothetical protein
MVVMFVCFIVYNESTAVTEQCVGLQNSMDLGETVPSVCSETCLTVCADGSEVSDMRVEEVLHTQEEDHLAVALPAVKAADKVCYLCNICSVNSGAKLYCGICIVAVCCVVFRCDFTVKMETVCCFESSVPTHEIKHNNM